MKKTMLIALSLFAAALGLSGPAQAARDCIANGDPNVVLCVFEDGPTPCGSQTCYGYHNQPLWLYSNDNVDFIAGSMQEDYGYSQCYGSFCYGEDGESFSILWVNVFTFQMGPQTANVLVYQNKADGWDCYQGNCNSYSGHATGINPYVSLSTPAGTVIFNSYYYQESGGEGCTESMGFSLNGNGDQYSQACLIDVPFLEDVCASQGDLRLCGEYPDWPDDTGLPFL